MIKILVGKDFNTEWEFYKLSSVEEVMSFMIHCTLHHQNLVEGLEYFVHRRVASSDDTSDYAAVLREVDYLFHMDSGDFEWVEAKKNDAFYCPVDPVLAKEVHKQAPMLVYHLYDDGSTLLATDSNWGDCSAGFAIDADAWVKWCKEQMRIFNGLHGVKCEPDEFDIARVIRTKKGGVAIFQMDVEQAPCFREYAFCEKAGVKVEPSIYKPVFTGQRPMLFRAESYLEHLFALFNADDKPVGYKGRSMSVSDVVVINDGTAVKAYYVQGAGFKEVPEFLDAYNNAHKGQVCIKGYGWMDVEHLDLNNEFIACRSQEEDELIVDVYAINGTKLSRLTSLVDDDVDGYIERLNEQVYNGRLFVCSCVEELGEIIRYSESTVARDCMKKVLSVNEYADLIGLEVDGNSIEVLESALRESGRPYSLYKATPEKAKEIITQNVPCAVVFDGSRSVFVDVPYGEVTMRLRGYGRTIWERSLASCIAVRVEDRYIAVSLSEDGDSYTYAIYDVFYKYLGGGVWLDGDKTATEALLLVISDLPQCSLYAFLSDDVVGGIRPDSVVIPVSFTEFDRRVTDMKRVSITCSIEVCRDMSKDKTIMDCINKSLECFISEDFGSMPMDRGKGVVGQYDCSCGRLFVIRNGENIVVAIAEND